MPQRLSLWRRGNAKNGETGETQPTGQFNPKTAFDTQVTEKNIEKHKVIGIYRNTHWVMSCFLRVLRPSVISALKALSTEFFRFNSASAFSASHRAPRRKRRELRFKAQTFLKRGSNGLSKACLTSAAAPKATACAPKREGQISGGCRPQSCA